MRYKTVYDGSVGLSVSLLLIFGIFDSGIECILQQNIFSNISEFYN